MSLNTEQRLLEFAKWFAHHRNHLGDVHKQLEFTQKAIDNLGLVLLHALEDIKTLEGRGRIGSNLEVVTPHNMLQRVKPRYGGPKLDLKKIGNG